MLLEKKLVPDFEQVLKETDFNITNVAWYICVESEKYALLVTLRPLGSMKQGETELSTLHYETK